MQRHYLYQADEELILPPGEEEMRKSTTARATYFRRLNDRLPAELVQSFGPTDIALPFPLHLSLVIEEKRILRVEAEIGWLHQGIEKAFEFVSWQTGPLFAARINPRISAPIGLGFVLALEKLLAIESEVPAVAQTWRVVMLECSRIFHHLRIIYKTLTLSAPFALKQFSAQTLALAETLYQHVCYDDQKQAQWSVGGLGSALLKQNLEQIKREIEAASKAAHVLSKDILYEDQIKKRLHRIGAISKDTALSFGLTGPALRASGVSDDLRRSHPYFNYLAYAPSMNIQQSGDAWARFRVRLQEMTSSFQIIEKAVDDILIQMKGVESLQARVTLEHIDWEQLPVGFQTSSIEAPEGELAISIVSDGKNLPRRVRLRTPSFAQTAALPAFLQDADIDDVVLIILSLGISGLELDR